MLGSVVVAQCPGSCEAGCRNLGLDVVQHIMVYVALLWVARKPIGIRRLIDLVLNELDDDALEQLAGMLAPWSARRVTATSPSIDRWLDTRRAAEYLGITVNALHKQTAARSIPFEQDCPGGKCWSSPLTSTLGAVARS